MGQQPRTSDVGQGQRKLLPGEIGRRPAPAQEPVIVPGLNTGLAAASPVEQQRAAGNPQFSDAIQQYTAAGMPLDLILKGLLAAR